MEDLFTLPSSGALAFLGDGVFSLCVRRTLVLQGISHQKELNEATLRYVTAEAQAKACDVLLPLLTEEENDVFRRARNSTHLHAPKHARVCDYRAATGLEAVFGYLQLTGQDERIATLFEKIVSHTENGERTTL